MAHRSQLILLGVLIASCGSRPHVLNGGADSAESLIQSALDRLAMNDAIGMDALRITRFEHDSLLVPEMPIGKAPKGLVDLNMAYVMLEQNNTKGLHRALSDYGGHRFELIKVDFPQPLETYGPFTVYRETVATVRDSVGNEFILPIFGSLIEAGGRFKLAAYID